MSDTKNILVKILLVFFLFSFGLHNISFAEFETSQENIVPKSESLKYSGVIVQYKKQKVNLSNFVWYMTTKDIAESNDMVVSEIDKKLNISLFEVTQDNVDISQVMEDLSKLPSVESVQPNYVYETLDYNQNNDTYKDNLWGLSNSGQTIEWQSGNLGSDIDFDNAMQTYSGSYMNTGVVVAVLDTGVAYNHPDLINNMWNGNSCLNDQWVYMWGCIHGYDYDNNDTDPMILNEDHGTHVAGIIAATMNNNKWVIGVNPNAKIMAVKMQNMTTLKIVKAINFAKYNGVKVINASFGAYDWIDPLLYTTIKSFWDAGWLFIAAAWNDSKNHDLWGINRMFPAGYWVDNTLSGVTFTGLTNIISVAASDNQDNLSSFSDYGATTVHIAAPGTSIYSTIQSATKIWVYEEDFSLAYATGSIYSFATGWINNYFGANYGYNGIWWDTNYPFLTGSTQSYIQKTVDISGIKIPSMSFNVWCDAWKGNNSAFTDFLSVSYSTGWSFTEVEKIDFWHPSLIYTTTIWWKSGYYGNISYDLTSIKSSTLTMRFTWNSDENESTDLGCMIFGNGTSPFEIVGLDDGSDESYGYKNGTSMATPYVAGLASLAMSYRPDLTNINIKNAILQNGDNVATLSGKTITGKRINAYKTLLSIIPPDFTPDTFSFQTLTGQTLSTSVESNTIVVSGINTWATISISAWEYRIGNGAYTSANGVVSSGTLVTVRHTTSASYTTSIASILTIWWVSATFTSITGDTPPDTTPNTFSFQTLTGQSLSSLVNSNTVTISGINTWALVTILDGEYKIGAGSFTSQTGMIYSGDTLQIRHTTSDINNTWKTSIITIGTSTGTFTSQTYDWVQSFSGSLSSSGNTLSGSITVGSGFELIGETNTGTLYLLSGAQVTNFITGTILDTVGQNLAQVTLQNGVNLYTYTGSFNFERKLLASEEQTTWNTKQTFTGVISLGSSETILLDIPATIRYFTDKNASKVAYRKTGTSSWNIISIEASPCTLDLSAWKPVCAYRVASEIYIKTYHFTDFALVKEETIVVKKSSGGWGWWWGLSKDVCPNGDFSKSYYDKDCGVGEEKNYTSTGKYNQIKDNNAQFLDKKLTSMNYKWYVFTQVQWYKLSSQIQPIIKYIIDNKKITSQDKKKYITTFENFLLARYHLEGSSVKTQILKNAYIKQTILLRNTIKRLQK